MNFNYILLIIVFGILRKNIGSKETNPELRRLFLAGIIGSALILALEASFHVIAKFTMWLVYPVVLALLLQCIYNKKFLPVRSFALALLPYMVISFVEDLVELISTAFYKEWGDYFEVAKTFAIIWLVAMMYVNKRQRRVLEKQRLEAEEKQRAFELSEKLKAELEIQVLERTADLNQQKEALETTLKELRSTQTQLIQSEKMASLGELTAGIAHEIQNPLNFVNNFSEVSSELLTEMVDEMDIGHTEDVKAIVADIQQNLQKILHHGKRADAIVKGMLQHSRASSGVKETTDVNALADEYLRLAYHGLRAKNKSFNANIKTDLDENLPQVEIIPQDIGRVILNLLTNAFYAVTEKKNALTGEEKENYHPTVTVKTRRISNEISITIKDNGNGIPQHALDKIFQPFFTTKPTGEGTGLGLSMSYDIVTKGHGGELLVNTTENTGTEFTINLPIKTIT